MGTMINKEVILENAFRYIEAATKNPFLTGADNKDYENDNRLFVVGYIQGVLSLAKALEDICDVWTDEHL